ncbi:SDR family NAD(P)-dependent oxidoreductase [Nonomuraea turcica]|uniref:SDR family NAD(P)-dependent oxidoreductase n=1 Tax=Nonomuraea sp. G32 TaxID=3067274 RepID=UPI00273BE399|nr:SDR family NAD(P)-dependent oxidoreductase [Nonomuraea sp. G32]MDP4508446.1 SDR family NAD(P)-dependent oxidoreductase [Nonomuraea sp. G32]
MTDNTTALVTGANKGIGYEVAAGLAAKGMTVLLGSRDRTRGEQAAARLRAAGGDVRPIVLDVTDPATIEAAAAGLPRLDVLVNNAGISGPLLGLPSTTTAATVREVFETNVIGVLMVTNALLPLLRRSPAGRIVNVSSGVGSLGHHTDPEHYMSGLPASATYPVSKTALNQLTVQYAKELSKDGILVNAAAPGACATDFTKDLPFPITRTAAEGAAVIVKLATLPPDGPTGGFFDDAGTVPW